MKTKYLNDFFIFLNENKVSYCVVGQTKSIPEIIPSDIDIVVAKRDYKTIKNTIINFSRTNNARIVQILPHEQTARCYVLSFLNENNQYDVINLDICCDFFIHGKYLLSAEELLNNRSLADNKKFYITAPALEFIYYLTKKIHKGNLTEPEFKHLSEQYHKDISGCKQQTEKYWPKTSAKIIVDALKTDNYLMLKTIIGKLLISCRVRSNHDYKDKFKEVVRKISRVLKPTGLIIVFLGPDGVGKTTVGEGIKTSIMPAFRKLSCFHLRPYSFTRSSSNFKQSIDVTDPHKLETRNQLSSIVKLFYFLADYIFGYLLIVRPLKVRSTLVVFDRYYHDLLIDPKRYRYGAPLWIAKLVGWFIPKPDLFVILDAPTAVIQHRKQEVSIEETERQRLAYLEFAKQNANCVVLDTSSTLAEAVNAGSEVILSHMNHRQVGK